MPGAKGRACTKEMAVPAGSGIIFNFNSRAFLTGPDEKGGKEDEL